MSQERPHGSALPSLVRAAYEHAGLRAAASGPLTPRMLFAPYDDGPTLEAWALPRVAALANLDPGLGDGALCVFDVPKEKAARLRDRLEALGDATDPPLLVRLETFPVPPWCVAVMATVRAPHPPYLIGMDPPASLSPGECWVFGGGDLRRAARSDLDALYACWLGDAPASSNGRQIPVSTEDLKAGLLRLGDPQAASAGLLAHRIALDACRAWRDAKGDEVLAGRTAAGLRAAADELTTIGMVGLASNLRWFWEAAASSLRALYLLAVDPPDWTDMAAAMPAEESLARLFLLGGLATHLRAWRPVAGLLASSVPGRIKGEYPLVDHPLFSPGVGRTIQDFFDRALALSRKQPAWEEEFGSTDLMIDAVCQFDLLAGASSPSGSSHFLNFARFEKARVAPVVALVRRLPTVFSPVLGDRADERLDRYLRETEAETGADFGTFASWWSWGQRMEDLT